MPLLVVLVRTHNPGNLGAAARAVKNFGAELAVLEPRAAVDHPDALAFASGAEAELRSAKALVSWDELAAYADSLVALTSLRGRLARGLPPRLTWPGARSLLATGERVALVFGPERGGLTTEELRRCDARLRIEAVEEFPTLNLAQSVGIALALSRPFEAARGGHGDPGAADERATGREVRRLLNSFRAALTSAGYPGRGHSKEVVAEMEAFFRRGRPTAREVTLFLGAFSALNRAAGRSRSAGRRTDTPSPAR